MLLSKKSERFLEDLRVYLFSSGKKDQEIDDIIDELKVHLMEAEKGGKSIEKVVGNSPKEYMEMISREMAIDYKVWTKYIILIVIGSMSFPVFQDLLKGTLSYSLLTIFGDIGITFLFLFLILKLFKYISAHQFSRTKEFLVIFSGVFIPLALQIALPFANQAIDTPLIHFGEIGSIIIGIVLALFILGLSLWAKTWILMVVLAFILLPDYLLGFTSLEENTKLLTSSMVTFIGIGLYLIVYISLNKKESQ